MEKIIQYQLYKLYLDIQINMFIRQLNIHLVIHSYNKIYGAFIVYSVEDTELITQDHIYCEPLQQCTWPEGERGHKKNEDKLVLKEMNTAA